MIAALAAAAALAVLRLAVTAVMVTAFALFLGAAWTEYRASRIEAETGEQA